MKSCIQHETCTCQQVSHPYVFMMHQKLLIGMPFTHADLLLLKFTTSHIHTLNNENANENVYIRLCPKIHKLGGFEVGSLPLLVADTQLVDVTQTTTKLFGEKDLKI